MKKILLVIPFLLLLACSQQENKPENLLKLWYNKPAVQWEEALPLGNGRLGAMVFGASDMDIIQCNEETVWAGEPGNNLPRGFKEILPQVRKLIFEGKYKEAEQLTMSKVPRHAPEWNNYGMPYQTVGDIRITFPGHETCTDYYRELDIQNAICATTYQVDGISYKREYFISAVDQVMVIRLSASEKGKITCLLDATTPHSTYLKEVGNEELLLSGKGESADNKEGKIRFSTIAKPVLSGGSLSVADGLLSVNGADEVTIYVSIGTNFKSYKDISGEETVVARQYLDKALVKPFSDMKNAHIADYRSFFDRVDIDLGITDSIKNTTDKRIVDFNDGYDPQLVSLYFQFGRYLLISSSRPGTQPANLQGIWNHKLKPSWDSKYTVNINTEMNYWPAEVTGLSEMHQPLFSMVKDLSETGKEAARVMYGAKGWVMHHNTDIWRITGPVDGAFYGMWPMGGAWLTQHMWQHYMYSGDRDFLMEVYPILKGAAQYYADVLQKEPTNGWMVVAPCMSPENKHPQGASMAAGNTMDNQLVFDVFSNLLKAADILQVDKAFADSVQQIFTQLAPMQIGQHNQLQEWLQDWDRTDDHHRHVSHLYGLFPSNQISPYRTPELFQAAKNSLIYRGDKSTGWSMGWKVNLWARLLNGDRAFKLIKDQLSPAPIEKKGQHGGTYPNLFDAHPPFQIDGNFGCTSGVAEMLVQSHDRAIHVLPALPTEWKDGKVKGLQARGGFEIDLRWLNGEINKIVVHSKLGGNCRIRSFVPLKGEGLTVADGENVNPFYKFAPVKSPIVNHTGTVEKANLKAIYEYDMATSKGDIITIYRQ